MARNEHVKAEKEIHELKRQNQVLSERLGECRKQLHPSDFQQVPPARTDPPKSENRPLYSRGETLGLLVSVVGTMLAVISPQVWQKLLGYALTCAGFSYAFSRSSWTSRFSAKGRLIVSVLVFIALIAIPYSQFAEQWRIEHLHSELVFSVYAPGVAHPDGDYDGIRWQKEFAEDRLKIRLNAKYPIEHLYLSVGAPDGKPSIDGMAQVDADAQGCSTRKPRMNVPGPGPLPAKDGSLFDIGPSASDVVNSGTYWRDHYELHCDRIEAGQTIEVVVASLVTPQPADPLTQLHIYGDYETTATEGNKRISVDEVISITKPQR